jgi:uracil-DNA glycosylase
VTIHPSYLLRLQDKHQAEDEFAQFVEDLKIANARVAALAA